MEMFTKSMEAMKKVNSSAPAPTAAPGGGGGGGGGTRSMKPKCPHCNICHLNHDDCWDLKKNKAKRPANNKPAAQCIAERQAKASS